MSNNPDGSVCPACEWLVWSNEHDCYWGPDRAGYTSDITKAGRYTLKDADSITRIRSKRPDGRPPEIAVPSPELIQTVLASCRHRPSQAPAMSDAEIERAAWEAEIALRTFQDNDCHIDIKADFLLRLCDQAKLANRPAAQAGVVIPGNYVDPIRKALTFLDAHLERMDSNADVDTGLMTTIRLEERGTIGTILRLLTAAKGDNNAG